MAPASHPGLMPIMEPALINATPMVPHVVHELPERIDTTAERINDAARKMDGWISFSP